MTPTPLALVLEEVRHTWAVAQVHRLTSRRFFNLLPPKFDTRVEAELYLRMNTSLLDWEMIECSCQRSRDVEVFTYCVHTDTTVWDEGCVPAHVNGGAVVQALNADQALRYAMNTTW